MAEYFMTSSVTVTFSTCILLNGVC